MSQQKDITTIEDIKLLVDTFYEKVRVNNLLGGVFNSVIKDRWPAHLEKMYSFWQTVLLGEHTYFGTPFPPHAQLPVGDKHFEAWLKLWHQTIDEHFTGDRAEEAKWRAGKMAVIFLSKIQYHQSQISNP
jgi:hemoglobin